MPAHIELPLSLILIGFVTILYAGTLGLVSAGIWWFLRIVLMGSDHSAFIETWRTAFWIIYVLIGGAWIWISLIRKRIIPPIKIMRKHECSFSQAYDFAARKYWDEMIRFALEKPEGYEPWDVDQHYEWRKARGIANREFESLLKQKG